MFSITGIASGLDTDNMLRQLLQIERLPVVKLEQQQASLRKVDDAWGEVTKRLSSLRTAINDLVRGTSFSKRWQAESSNDATATAKVTGTPSPGTTTFDVGQLASAQSSHSGAKLGSPDALVGAGTITLTQRTGDKSVIGSITTDATTTLADLARDIDALAGVQASVVKVADGDHRLVLSAEQTGTANAFDISVGAGSDLEASLGAFTEKSAQNAQLTVGSLTVSRSSNTVTDLVEGVTVTLKSIGTTTITTSQDVDSAVSSIKKIVNEVNAALSKLKELSGYDADLKKGGVLQGDPTARRLVDQLRYGIMNPIGAITDPYSTAGSVGIRMNKDGGFSIDEAKLKAALTDAPDAVQRLFNRSGAVDGLGDVSYVSATKTTQAGNYKAYVRQAAAVASLTGAALASPPPPDAQYTITGKDGKTVSITVSAAASISEAVTQINQQIAAASDAPAVEASVNAQGDRIVLTGSRYGSAHGFDVTSSSADEYGLAGSATGVDAQIELYGDGTGNGSGTVFTGKGKAVTVTSGAAEGLVLSVGPDAGLAPAGTVTVGQGIAGRLDQFISAYEGTTGAIQGARNSVKGRIDLYQDRIEAFELRIASRETTIRRQFTAMEAALSQLQSQGNWLAGQLGALSQPQQ